MRVGLIENHFEPCAHGSELEAELRRRFLQGQILDEAAHEDGFTQREMQRRSEEAPGSARDLSQRQQRLPDLGPSAHRVETEALRRQLMVAEGRGVAGVREAWPRARDLVRRHH